MVEVGNTMFVDECASLSGNQTSMPQIWEITECVFHIRDAMGTSFTLHRFPIWQSICDRLALSCAAAQCALSHLSDWWQRLGANFFRCPCRSAATDQRPYHLKSAVVVVAFRIALIRHRQNN